MKIAINLASQPFRRDRAMIVGSLAVSALLIATLVLLTQLALQDRRQLADVRKQVAGLDQRIRTVNVDQAKLDSVVKKPENASVIEQSVFLNSLLRRKGLSWNRIFTDLEKTIPYNVKIVRIHPTVDDQDHVILEMVVAAESAKGIADMLRALEESPLFGTLVSQSQAPANASDPLYRMTVSVPYAQKL
jgi:Tfp pilus assembly protein PilN